MKITPYIHYDLYSNGNFVKSFNSKEDIDKYFHISVDFLQRFWYNKSIKQLNSKQNKER